MSNELALMREIAKLQEQINALRTIEIGGVWQNWTPTLSASGSMTVSSVSGLVAKYSRLGNFCFFGVRAIFTTGGTESTAIYIDPPIDFPSDIADDYFIYQFSSRTTDGGPANAAMGGLLDSGGGVYIIAVQKYDLSNWSLGTSRQFRVGGFYRVA